MNKKPTAVASRGFVEIFILATTSTLGIGGYYYPGYQNYQHLSDLQEHFGKNTNGTAEVKQSIQRFFSEFKFLVANPNGHDRSHSLRKDQCSQVCP